jgi:hypothetical protein
VIEEAGLRVAQVRLREQHLLDRVVERRRLPEHRRVAGQERRRHVDAVGPHLMRVDLLVPEAAVRRARLRGELRAQRDQRLAVALPIGGVAGFGAEREQHLAHVDVVEHVVVRVVALDGAARPDQPIDVRLDVFEVAAVAGLPPDGLESRQHQADVVVPAVGQHRAAPHDAVARRPRPLHRPHLRRNDSGRSRPGRVEAPRQGAGGREQNAHRSDGQQHDPDHDSVGIAAGLEQLVNARGWGRRRPPALAQACGNPSQNVPVMSLPDPVRTPTEQGKAGHRAGFGP